ncbi:MAG: hypothetical protein CMC76_12245 [Flavobacteriaceae bacterium]|nr:hypothetical protein [Flavobacteriaceae bacterium]|tara:strand:+ start:2730 stop:3014 length:285 start_codon:yes stop_codon:yes gene_type:complete
METAETTHLKKIYAKRVQLLKHRWDLLMQEQDTLSHEQVCSDAFQAKRKRIGHLYHTLKRKIQEPTSKAIRASLLGVHQNRFRLPQGEITVKIK